MVNSLLSRNSLLRCNEKFRQNCTYLFWPLRSWIDNIWCFKALEDFTAMSVLLPYTLKQHALTCDIFISNNSNIIYIQMKDMLCSVKVQEFWSNCIFLTFPQKLLPIERWAFHACRYGCHGCNKYPMTCSNTSTLITEIFLSIEVFPAIIRTVVKQCHFF